MKETALVISCTRNGLGVIRSLGSCGYNVIAVDHKGSSALYSKYVKRKYVIDPIKKDVALFINDIIAIAKENQSKNKILLIPTSDVYVELFCRFWNQLEMYFHPVFETNANILHSNINKTAMYKMASQANVDCPDSFYDYREVKEDCYPVIIKPDQKRHDDSEQNIFRIKKCLTSEELKKYASLLESSSVEYVVQRYIPGGDDELYTAGVFIYKGKLIAVSCGRKLRQFPPQLGQCSFGELVDRPELEEISKRFALMSGITGICQIEFKHYKGRYYLMEINPRSWSWNSLIDFSGVNLPAIACDCIMNPKRYETRDIIKASTTKGTWMFVEQDLIFNVLLNRNISFIKFIKDFMSADKFAHFDIRDPLPWFVFVKNFSIALYRKYILS